MGSITSGPKRKKQHCPYCENAQSRLSRRILTHCGEAEVRKYKSCTDPKIKTQMMAKFRKLDNHMHNLKAVNDGHGTLNVVYCPKEDSDLTK